MPKPIKTEEMIKSIRGILKDFSEEAIHIQLSDGCWGAEITNRLYAEGIRREFEAYAPGARYGHQWVFDLCWVKRCDDITVSLPLAVEIEWNSWQEVKEDFEKLLWSKAQLRCLIFYAETKREENIKELKNRIKAFEGTRPGDTYLFCVCGGNNRFRFYEHLAARTHNDR